jgi:hypothetical protein
MRTTIINPSYVRNEVKRDCYYLLNVEIRFGEIEMTYINDTPLDAIVGKDPQNRDMYVCLAIDGRITWSKGYKTIKSAIKNACLI